MPDRAIPYGRQLIEDDDVEAVAQALRSDFLTTGPLVAEFESSLAAAAGVLHAAALNSGTAALHAAYEAVGIGPGDEIVTSPLTFAATGNAALYLGARPVFADVDPATGTLDAGAAEAAITPRTKAIVAVDYAGLPADYDELNALARGHGLPLIDDAAHSIGASYKGRPAGSLATASTFSFHPVKTITTGEGGAVVTDDDRIDESVRRFRTHGMEHDAAKLRRQGRAAWYHEMEVLGFNYRLTDVQCALGTSQLRKLRRNVERRAEIARRYDDAFADLTAIEVPTVPADRTSAWHLYVVKVRDARLRDAVYGALRARGILVQVHYLPVYLHPLYEDLGYLPGQCPIAERFASSCLSLPMFPSLTETDIDRVIGSVRGVVREVLGA